MAPPVGFEPTTLRLTAECSTAELRRNLNIRRVPTFPGRCQPDILGTGELNFCVRDGNRCGLSVSLTGMVGSAGLRLQNCIEESR
jgi:hypothetical protein